jgi:thymidylate synthase
MIYYFTILMGIYFYDSFGNIIIIGLSLLMLNQFRLNIVDSFDPKHDINSYENILDTLTKPKEEDQYILLIRNILDNGNQEISRNGNTLSIFGHCSRYNLKNGQLPILTTKKMAWKMCFHELMWFIRGSTDNRELNAKNVHIWDANASREFLDGRSLSHMDENDLGPIYGHQWRHFNASYMDFNTDYTNKGVDQLSNLIKNLKCETTRNSRRHIITAWNPCQIDEMALPPCHILMQFNVRDNKYLSCALYQRSGDVGLGVPFNITSYAFLTHIIAHHCGLEADEFVHFLGNAHIYEEHIDALKTQIIRTPFNFPKIKFRNIHENIEDYCLEDIEWIMPYKSHQSIKMTMKA